MQLKKKGLKKFRNKSCMLLGLVGLLACSAVGCNKDKDDVSNNNPPIVSGEATPTASPELTVTPTPTEKPRNLNPLNLGGYTSYKEKAPLDSAGNVHLLASIDEKLKAGDKFVTSFDVLSYTDEQIVVKYLTADEAEDFVEGIECKQHFAVIDADSLEIVNSMELEGSFYVQASENVIAFEEYADDSWTVRTYDYNLNEIAVMKTPNGVSGFFTPDGKRCYYVADKRLYVLNGDNGIAKEVGFKENFIINHLNGVLADEAGNEYVVVWGMAADYNEYHAIFNATTGEIMRVYEDGASYSVLSNNSYVEFMIGDFYTVEWMAGVSKDAAFDYKWNGETVEVNLFVMKDQNMLFTYELENKLYFLLYEYETGTLLASTSIDITSMRSGGKLDYFGVPAEEVNLVYLYDIPVYMNEDALLLHLGNYNNEHFFLQWNLAVDASVPNNIEVKAHEMGSASSVDISQMNNPLYIPGKLSDSLKPLRERADEMEETYGVEIYIGEECSNIIGNYSIKPLLDYETVEESLELLEVQMEKYPDNFFEQFTYDWIEGLDIYLADTLTGISEDVLDYAGGFKTLHDSKILMVLDCTDTYSITSTFHHELSHVIEEKIINHSYTQANPVFNEDVWNGFNPYEDMYTYTYAEFGRESYWDYAYEEIWWNDGDMADSYFVDTYAMTYPTEDRARLFEAVMSDVLFDIDFENTPHLEEKLNYYAKCIRDAFDTTGWENVPWEAYMD